MSASIPQCNGAAAGSTSATGNELAARSDRSTAVTPSSAALEPNAR